MLNYKTYLEGVIARRDYELPTMEDKINRLWLDGKIDEADRDALMQLAAQNARESLQINIVDKFAEIERRLYNLEFPTDIYPIYEQGQVSERGVVYRADVTGDGEYDLVRYDGGRQSTSLSIGKIEGWHMLDRELTPTHSITRDASGGYVLTPIESEAENDENEA